MPPLTQVQLATVTRHQQGVSPRIRQRSYDSKLATILNDREGTRDTVMFPGEFIQFLLDGHGNDGDKRIDPETFSIKLGQAPGYFRADIFNNHHNDGGMSLPFALCQKLARLTNKDFNFWQKRNFTPRDAEGLRIDLTRNISDLTTPAPKALPSAKIQNILDRLPQLAAILLVDDSGQWRHSSFLFDASGNLKSGFKAFKPIINDQPALDAVAAITARHPNAPDYKLKGFVLRNTVKEAKRNGL